jgi:membrane fusion protein
VAQRPSLFRQEAVDFQRLNRDWGQVAFLQPLSIKVTTWFITVTITLIISFLFLGQYSRKETVVGYVTPTSGTSKVFAPQQGTIKRFTSTKGRRSAKVRLS